MLIEADYLVIGTGIAGLSFALKAAEHGWVNLICKRASDDTNTNRAQGGIAAVLGDDDQLEYHIRDTLASGDGLCHYETVKTVIEAGPGMIRELRDMGVPFTAAIDHPDRPELGREGGHSRRRVVHANDMTGQAVQRTLLRQVLNHPNINIYDYHLALDLITDRPRAEPGGICRGAYVLDQKGQTIKNFTAPAVVMASGGSGLVYLYTTNPDGATGDGLAMGWRAGARAANMEFIQFHPTCLYHHQERNFLISEAVRGEGGRLLDLNGRAFMEKYHPLKDLAFRDIVARAIDGEMKKSGADHVMLDISHRPAEFIRSRFPNIYQKCLSLGLDITKEPIPVVPAAHYQCGGLVVDIDGRTDLKGLYAIGEAACTGLHGANRLASNSLLEALVMADRAARAARADLAARGDRRPVEPAPWPSGRMGRRSEAVVVAHNWQEIRMFMWNYVGIVRSDDRLKKAWNRLRLIKDEIGAYFRDFEVDSDLIELRNIADVAELIIRCARSRKESRGLHYTLDYPRPDDRNFKKDTVLTPERRAC